MRPELGGKTAIFDLDMTLVEYTFAPAVFDFADNLARITGEDIDRGEFRREWQGIFENFRPLLVVNPIVTTVTAQILMERHGLNNQSEEGRRLLYELNKAIYNTPEAGTQLCPGAVEAVAAAEKVCAQVLIGTIAKKGWTNTKLARSGLKNYFSNGNVHCFNVNLAKGEQWGELLDHYQLDPKEIFVVGDDLKADILPMLGLGVELAFWVNNGKMPDAEFEAIEVPEGVVKLATTGQLVEYLSPAVEE